MYDLKPITNFVHFLSGVFVKCVTSVCALHMRLHSRNVNFMLYERDLSISCAALHCDACFWKFVHTVSYLVNNIPWKNRREIQRLFVYASGENVQLSHLMRKYTTKWIKLLLIVRLRFNSMQLLLLRFQFFLFCFWK